MERGEATFLFKGRYFLSYRLPFAAAHVLEGLWQKRGDRQNAHLRRKLQQGRVGLDKKRLQPAQGRFHEYLLFCHQVQMKFILLFITNAEYAQFLQKNSRQSIEC